ncbi:hypothetical protein SKAU_G00308790, partial [Synaphobranchus kaupii]
FDYEKCRRRKKLGRCPVSFSFPLGVATLAILMWEHWRTHQPLRQRATHSHLGEAAHEVGQGLWVGALQLLDDLKTLVELCEDVDHGAGEQSVLRRGLELHREMEDTPLRTSVANHSCGGM